MGSTARLWPLAAATLGLAPMSRASLLLCASRIELYPAASMVSRSFSATPRPRSDRDENVKKSSSGRGGQIDEAIGAAKELQARTPWHREGSDQPPVRRNRSAGAMTKGKLLTTPSRLLKLVLPLTTLDKNSDRKDIEPLALLVHPHQPLSYLERLIQSELPTIKDSKGENKVPEVHFWAEDSVQDEIKKDKRDDSKAEEEEEEGGDEERIDGKTVKTGKISSAKERAEARAELRGGPGEGGVEVYSGQGREGSAASERTKFVRWSSSTEIGDFIRDAARGKEFAVQIDGAEREIYVGVPSFNDRTHYLRVRLNKVAEKLDGLAAIKKECDQLAHRSAQRLAMAGFGMLVTWWGAIYHFTFQTDYGWDTMEPITYLAGLSTIMLGYLWFLYHNREVSYRAALNLTVSRRQNQLYQVRGFDVGRWDAMIEEANALRKEIKAIANEYDVEWDESFDAASEKVVEALRNERKKNGSKKEKDDDDDDDGAADEGKKAVEMDKTSDNKDGKEAKSD